MKRLFTIVAASALVIGVSLPAAALSKPDSSAASTQATPGVAADNEQGIDVVVAAEAPAERDLYAAEPKPVVEVAPAYASGAYSGPIPDVFLGMFSVWPAPGSHLEDGFGYRDGGEWHGGIDLLAPAGMPIVAAGAGTVVQIDYGGGWGQYVKIDHGQGVQTLYAHMLAGSPTVSPGQFVEAGQLIGSIGATGYATTTHVHFEVWIGGGRVDPMPFFG